MIQSDGIKPKKMPMFDLKNITKELFSSTAQSCAQECANNPVKRGKGNCYEKAKNCNESTQLRRFYNELLLWEERTDSVEKLKENLPFIYMIKSKVSYAVGRGTVDLQFQEMMNNLIDGIKENDIQTLKNAKLFLEAFMGFYKELKG